MHYRRIIISFWRGVRWQPLLFHRILTTPVVASHHTKLNILKRIVPVDGDDAANQSLKRLRLNSIWMSYDVLLVPPANIYPVQMLF